MSLSWLQNSSVNGFGCFRNQLAGHVVYWAIFSYSTFLRQLGYVSSRLVITHSIFKYGKK